MPDIDIDFFDREQALSVIKHIPASRIEQGEYKKHNTGVYLQDIPVDGSENISSIDYETAERRGYFKIDFLNVNIYKDVKNEEHLMLLMEQEPLWDLLEQKEFCDMIFHINRYHKLIAELKPRSIEELAMFLSLLRPGKKHLIEKCKEKGWASIESEIWMKAKNDYSFKRSHSIAYATAILVQMNLICEKISYEFF